MQIKESTFDLTSGAIIQTLWQHLREQRPVTLYNTYQGVPITYEAEVAMVNMDFLGLVVHPFQTVCIKQERRTYIESKMLPGLVRGYPVTVDYTNQVVLLKNLEAAKSISNDLYNSWVKPEQSVVVEIESEEIPDGSGTLLEIAMLDDNLIRAVLAVKEDMDINRLDHLNLTLKLPQKGDLVQIQGVVDSRQKIRSKPLHRLGVEGRAAMQDEISVLAYIASREDAVMGQLEKAYKKLRKGKKRRKNKSS